jgi:hypothetical protein
LLISVVVYVVNNNITTTGPVYNRNNLKWFEVVMSGTTNMPFREKYLRRVKRGSNEGGMRGLFSVLPFP